MSKPFDAIYHPQNKIIWYLLAVQGGIVNVGGFLEVGHFVSHVTGFSGHLMIDLFNGNLLSALFFALIPLCFLTGAIFSGYLTEVRRKHQKQPIYIYIMSGLALLYLCLSILGAKKVLLTFGKESLSLQSAVILALLCGACGAQNALFTSVSGAVVRTTHLTGLFTDFGIGLAKLLGKVDLQKEKRSTLLRFGLIISFMLGSFIGVWSFTTYQHVAWIIPSLISFFIALRLYQTRKQFELILSVKDEI